MANGTNHTDLKIPRPQRDDKLTFLQGFLKKPQQVGSVVPSSRFLERRILKLANVKPADTIIELGPGTGGTTRAILRELGPEGRLLSIEIEKRFVALLKQVDDPRFSLHHGSALDIREIACLHGCSDPDIVISGIPFSTMPNDLGTRIIKAVQGVLRPGSSFVAYQLRDRVAELSRPVFGRPEVSLELINIPPMRVFKWTVDEPESKPASGVA